MPRLIHSVSEAAQLIRSGEVVAFPTETVYGLGAAADNAVACSRIYALKGRPNFNPLIVHVASLNDARSFGHFSEMAFAVAEKFWPGPLTLVVKLRAGAAIASNVTAGLDTVALRVPALSESAELIKLAGKPIAAPSANISNYVSATQVEHVLADFKDTDLAILTSDKKLAYGLESTIIDMTFDEPQILRHGFILPQDIQKVIGTKVSDAAGSMVKAPGMLEKHYSPITKVRLDAKAVEFEEVGIDFGSQLIGAEFNLSFKADVYEAAANLYGILRQADEYAIARNLKTIAIAPIMDKGIGVAINDRLKRAAAKI